jgi:hypothetical protein
MASRNLYKTLCLSLHFLSCLQPSRSHPLTFRIQILAKMQLSVLLSMGLALLPAMAEAADGGFNDSCKFNVGPPPQYTK